MEAIRKGKGLRLQVVVTGTHLLRKFGHTIDDVVADGWPVDARVPMQRGDDRALDQAEGLARGVAGIARFLERAKTNIVVVLGDRIEAMAGALAGVMTGRVVAHIHGGDVAPGDLDDTLRHSITKLAHLHFPATASAARRIAGMGESPERIHVVGAPGLDRLAELIAKRRTSSEPRAPARGQDPSLALRVRKGARLRAIIVQHPCGRSAAYEKRVMNAILRAATAEETSAVCIYPNSDRGHSGIIEAIEAHRRRADPARFQVVRSMARDDYLRALIDSDLLIGNSSSGIIEAASAGTAVVNIGPRQRGRETSGDSIIHCDESFAAIRKAIGSALRKRPIMGRRTVYGNGNAGPRIAAILASIPMDATLLRK
jgi:UDP-hydrolysing UDP-N-acetyl-D-glucosamine 2-epimerase